MKISPIIFVSFFITSFNLMGGEAYKWIDENGNIQFTDQKPDDRKFETYQLKNIQTIQSVSYDHSPIDTGRKVIIFTTSWCGYCNKAKAYFKNKNIQYTEMDIEKNPEAERQYKDLGGSGVPVILVGKKRMNGFSESGFENIYK